MNNFLAIDTSSSACSVAVYSADKLLDELVIAPQDHIRRLLPMIDRLMAEASIQLSDLDAIVYSAGPGSFTGLRICLGTVQGLAFGADIPVIPISTMLACAQTAFHSYGLLGNSLIIPCFDARMGEVYWGAFETRPSKSEAQPLKRLNGDSVTSLKTVITRMADMMSSREYEQLLLVGDGWSLLSEEQKTSLHDRHHRLSIDTALYPNARYLPALALDYLETQEPLAAHKAEPRYIRNEVSWKKREKIRS